jgi:ABC-type nitrate/sulfonate/bicarbonate transport system substrate-binding protein
VGQGQQIMVTTPSAFAAYFFLMVNDKVKSWNDFKTAAVGMTATNDSSYYTTVLMLKQNNIDPNGINWVTVRGSAARAQALVAGKIDAGQLQAAQVLEVQKQGNYRIMAQTGKEFPNLLFNGYWVSKSFAEKNPETVQAFTNAMMEAQREMFNKDRFMFWAKQWVPEIPDAELDQSYKLLMDMNIWDPNSTRWNSQAGEYTAKTLAEYEATEKYVPFTDWATTKFTDRARQMLGEFKQ